MPKLEEGPGHDFIQKRIQHDEAVEQARLKQFFVNMQCAAAPRRTRRRARTRVDPQPRGPRPRVHPEHLLSTAPPRRCRASKVQIVTQRAKREALEARAMGIVQPAPSDYY